MTGVPVTTFDYFDLAEIPTFVLCNPNKEELYALGGISERKYNGKFNAISEISFRADEYIDETLMAYYDYITYRRLVYLENIGYFMITDVKETNDGIMKYKEVTCQSLEVELLSKRFVEYRSGSGLVMPPVGTEQGIITGSYILNVSVPVTLENLLEDLLTYIPGWGIGDIPTNIATINRSFDITDKSLYDFLMTDIEEAYSCVFDFDTINKIINIYDPNDIIYPTSIYISHDNLIKTINIEEITDGLATCLNVSGGNDLGINMVNPLGSNYIYNLDYFETTAWMTQTLIDSLDSWENAIISASSPYSSLVDQLYTFYLEQADYDTQLNMTSGCISYWTGMYNGYLHQTPPDEAGASSASIVLESLYYQQDMEQAMHDTLQTSIDSTQAGLRAISDSLSFESNFSEEQIISLQPFIIQSTYVNDNIIVTENMGSGSMLLQSQILYDQAKNILSKTSYPKYTFTADSINFLSIPEFSSFSEQLQLGSQITLEVKEGTSTSAILLSLEMNFDDPTEFKLTFGNRSRLDDDAYKFTDLMNKAISAGTNSRLRSQSWNNWARNYESQVTNLVSGVSVTSPLNLSNQGVQVSPGFINFQTPSLTWNGIPIPWEGTGTGSGLMNITITLFSGGEVEAMYDPTAAGFSSAITDSSNGDTIFLPDVDITGDFEIPEGVSLVGVSSKQSILRGELGINPGSLLENLYIISEKTTGSSVAVTARNTTFSDAVCKINSCEIYSYMCGSGSAIGVYIAGASVDIDVESSVIVADSSLGFGYTFCNENDGYCKVYHSNYYGKTEVFHDL